MRFAEIFKTELFSKYGQKAGCYINEIYDLMRAMAPADMVVKVVIIFNRHRSFKPYTHAQMTKYTHYQLRTATDFETDFNTQVHLATYRHTQLSSYMQAALMTQKL